MTSEVKFDLNFEISNLNYLVSMCILPLTAISVAFEVMEASKQPLRLHLTSKLNSMTSITYVALLLWPLNASMS